MAQSSQKPKMQLSADNYGSRRARYHGLRAVARALGFRDFVEVRRPRSRKNLISTGPQQIYPISRPSRQTAARRRARIEGGITP